MPPDSSPEEKESFDLKQLVTEVYINFERLNKRLRSKYRAAFDAFTELEPENNTYPYCYFEFFYSFDLGFRYKETEAINQNYTGTYSYRILIDKETAGKLNRSKKDFSYYGIKSKEKAVEKMIGKSFEIIDCLLKGRELPEKARKI